MNEKKRFLLNYEAVLDSFSKRGGVLFYGFTHNRIEHSLYVFLQEVRAKNIEIYKIDIWKTDYHLITMIYHRIAILSLLKTLAYLGNLQIPTAIFNLFKLDYLFIYFTNYLLKKFILYFFCQS